MSEHIGPIFDQEEPSNETSLSINNLFNIDSQEDFREPSRVSSSHRDSPSSHPYSNTPVNIPIPEEYVPIVLTPETTPATSDWIYTWGYAERLDLDSAYMIRCNIKNCNSPYRPINESSTEFREHLKRKHGINGPADLEKPSNESYGPNTPASQSRRLNNNPVESNLRLVPLTKERIPPEPRTRRPNGKPRRN
ncbi:hypothetical protein DSO57_1028192 [Entomophthora muscae]|uniref:Uncharacterized protein n=1 Tax=Entomophthora muscae TaxID=34485 RepID=A0ACC2S3K1_9FUNG|nr:hypothetical protein DSO57_1028192 [Entomophthora muscae]